MVGRPASPKMRLQPRASGGEPLRRRALDNDEREEEMRSKHRVASLAATLAMCLVTVGVSAAVAPSAGAAGSNTLTVKAGEYTYKFSGSPKAGMDPDQLRERRRRVPHDGRLPVEEGRDRRAADEGGGVAETRRHSTRSRARARCSAHRPSSLRARRSTTITKLHGRALRVAVLHPGAGRRIAHRPRHGQDLRRRRAPSRT